MSFPSFRGGLAAPPPNMRMPSAAVDLGSIEDSKLRLLMAAERLILRGGLASVSLRRIAAEAQANSALVAYYFSGLPGLYSELAQANVSVMVDSREALIREAVQEPELNARREQVIEAYVRPMLFPSAYCGEDPASVVVRELLAGSDAQMRDAMVRRISQSVKNTANTLAPLVPHLSVSALVTRLRLLTGASVYLLPQVDLLGIFNVGEDTHPSAEVAYRELLAFARGALMAPEASNP